MTHETALRDCVTIKLNGWTEVDFVTAARALSAGHTVRQLWDDSGSLEESSSGIFKGYRCWVPDAALAVTADEWQQRLWTLIENYADAKHGRAMCITGEG